MPRFARSCCSRSYCSSTFRLNLPKKPTSATERSRWSRLNGSIRRACAMPYPKGSLFMRLLPEASEAAVLEASDPLPPERSGYLPYDWHHRLHRRGRRARARAGGDGFPPRTSPLASAGVGRLRDGRTLRRTVRRAGGGESVQIRSTGLCADRAPSLRRRCSSRSAIYYRSEGARPERSLDDILASYDCPYAITGTVTSAVVAGSRFVDDGALHRTAPSCTCPKHSSSAACTA